ncbi:hypothetical protein SDC9_131748 [bioreactor metagenome]|uniref:Uncharacterized protein n=1 Tax=bioreactor metagenome TaxID=1076179 RepID=A0A645D646_9ZZZZ
MGQQPVDRFVQRLGSGCQRAADLRQHCIGRFDQPARIAVDAAQQRLQRAPALACQLAADQVVGLDARGAFVDGRDARVAHVLGGAGFLDVAHAAMHLHAVGRDALRAVGTPAFDHRYQQADQGLRLRALLRIGVARGAVHLTGAEVGQRAHGLGAGLHVHQHAPHVRVACDGGAAADQRLALHPLQRIGACALVGALGNAHAFQANVQPRVVHHGEHAGQPLVRLADQVADSAAAVAKTHRRRGAAVDAHLVLNRRAGQVVAFAQGAIVVDQVLRAQEQRDAFHPRWRIG